MHYQERPMTTFRTFFQFACCTALLLTMHDGMAQDKASSDKGLSIHIGNGGIGISINGKDQTQGSGKVITQPRALSGYKALRLEGPIDMKLRASANEAVIVQADDNIVPLVETVVDNGVLVVSVKKNAGFHTKNSVLVTVDFKALQAAAIKGSGDMHIDNVQAEQFDASISGSGDMKIDQATIGTLSVSVAGSGDMTLQGTANTQSISVAGSGNVTAKQLTGKHVAVSVAGSGDVIVNATDTLEATIAGSGDISYMGNPKLKRSIVGSGEVVQLR
jgi:hypothetical protein